MRILIISREALFPNIGGHREYLLETINGLTNLGNYVDVLSWGIEDNYEYKNGNITEYHFKSESDKLENNNLEFIKKFASSIGIGQIHTIRHRGLDDKYASKLLENKYDLIIKNGPDSNGIAHFISSKLNIPMVERLDWVGLPYRSEYYKLWIKYIDQYYAPYNYLYGYFDRYVTKLEAKSALNADFIYTPTKRDMLKIRTYLKKDNLNYVHPFLHDESNSELINKKYNVTEDKYILFYSTPSINSYEAIKYIYKISKLNENLKFVITGDFKYLNGNFSRKNLNFIGEVPLDVFYKVLKNAYFVIFPLTFGHGIQMKLIRALSFSKTVIANDGVLKPMEDLITDYKDVVIGKTPNEFYDKILYLYQDENVVRKIGINSYNIYKKYFSPELNIKNLSSYLESILGLYNGMK